MLHQDQALLSWKVRDQGLCCGVLAFPWVVYMVPLYLVLA